MKKIKFIYSSLLDYKKKLFKVLFFEIFYTIFSSAKSNLFKEPDIHPCPYYFTHKISKFINKNKIDSLVELGCGFGRITNFLEKNTKAKIYGYEIDKEAFLIAKENKAKKTVIKLQDILKINFDKLNVRCFILNDPFYQLTKKNKIAQENLIKKIERSKDKLGTKYYIIAINISETRNYMFAKKKLVKIVTAGLKRKIKFYSN